MFYAKVKGALFVNSTNLFLFFENVCKLFAFKSKSVDARTYSPTPLLYSTLKQPIKK